MIMRTMTWRKPDPQAGGAMPNRWLDMSATNKPTDMEIDLKNYKLKPPATRGRANMWLI